MSVLKTIGGAVSSVFGRTGAVVAAVNDYTWAQINKGTSSLADIATRSHTLLTDIGNNTHAQVDTHLAAASPHSGHEVTSNKGTASGYASLDTSTFVPLAQIPTTLTGKDADTVDGFHGSAFATAANFNLLYAAGATNFYVDTALGTDDTSHGTSSGSGAFKTIQYAVNSVPGICGDNVIIYVSAGTYVENVIVQGKTFTGNYYILITGTPTNILSEKTASAGLCTAKTIGTTGQTWTIGSVLESGTNTSTAANKLIQSGQNFLTTCRVGMIVNNTTDGTWARITLVDSDTQLSLNGDIFTATSKAFQIGRGQYSGYQVRLTGGTGSGQRAIIWGNEATKIYIVGDWSFSQSKIISGARAGGVTPDGTTTYVIENLAGTTIQPASGDAVKFTGGQKNAVVRDLKAVATGTSGTIYGENGASFEAYGVYSSGGRGLYSFAACLSQFISSCYATGSANIAAVVSASFAVDISNLWSQGAGSGRAAVDCRGNVVGTLYASIMEGAGTAGLNALTGAKITVGNSAATSCHFLANGTWGVLAATGAEVSSASNSNNIYDYNVSGTRSPTVTTLGGTT